MVAFSSEQLNAMHKGQLREACRENSINYSTLNVDGMRAALLGYSTDSNDAADLAAGAVVAAATPEQQAPEVSEDPVETDPLAEFDAPLVVNTPVVVAAPKAATVRKIQADREERHCVKRPSDGTICARIWAWCDDQRAISNVPSAKALRAALTDVDNTTCTVQFYRWRKFNGISGRM